MIGMAETFVWIYTLNCGLQLPPKDNPHPFDNIVKVCTLQYCSNDKNMIKMADKWAISMKQNGIDLLLDPIICDNTKKEL